SERKDESFKKSEKVTKHHDLLTSEELKVMFNHEALSINTAKDLQYRGLRFNKFSQKNDPGGIDGNLDSLVIPVPADPEGYLGPIHDIKLYLSKRPENCKCEFFHIQINKNIR
ncbi:27179_t:CDS:2, partial [Racocetra persica]